MLEAHPFGPEVTGRPDDHGIGGPPGLDTYIPTGGTAPGEGPAPARHFSL